MRSAVVPTTADAFCCCCPTAGLAGAVGPVVDRRRPRSGTRGGVVMGAGVWSPLGEWHYAAPAGRYSAQADELRPGGSSTPAIVGTHRPVALFRGRDARRRAGGSLPRSDPPAAQPANHANPGKAGTHHWLMAARAARPRASRSRSAEGP